MDSFVLLSSSVPRYTVKSPLDCEVRSVRLIGSNGADRSFYHIVVDHKGQYSYEAGQYCGILPPGISERTNRPHTPRSYSLAPVLASDGADPSCCFSLGVSAPIVGEGDAARFRNICVCSRFLSSAAPGTPLRITGPFGRHLLSPEDLAGERNLLLIATGTGVVPYLGFLDALLKASRAGSAGGGRILLFFGVQSPSTHIYRDALSDYVSSFGGRLTVVMAYSRHGSESDRGYVQAKLLREAALVRSVCGSSGRGCSVYMCGRKSMEKDVLSSLGEVFRDSPDRESILRGLKSELYE